MVLIPSTEAILIHDSSAPGSALFPPFFTPAVGVRDAQRAFRPPKFGRCADRADEAGAAKRSGLRYERDVQEWLGSVLRYYEPGPWFEYSDATGKHWCQPDGVMKDDSSSTLYIFEIKRRWCVEGWWQLCRKYAPVLWIAYRPRRIICIGVCGSCDLSGTATPTRPWIASDLEVALNPFSGTAAPDTAFEGDEAAWEKDVRVVVWKARRLQSQSPSVSF